MAMKVKTYRCPAYLAWVRSLPCCHCRQPADDAHHVISEGCSGMGTKASDLSAVPLCRGDHIALHNAIPGTFPQLRWVLDTLDQAFSEGVFSD